MIHEFKDEHSWLSNMTPFEKPLLYGTGKYKQSYRTNEHFYVAMKSMDWNVRKHIMELQSPGKVKRFGRTLQIREDWDEIRIPTMRKGLEYKFSKHNPTLRQKLIDTGDQYIQEGNTWGDSFWGHCFIDEMGKNNLGKLIMERREEIKNG
jgi:ribA/ribD-fused uncharacterized protein